MYRLGVPIFVLVLIFDGIMGHAAASDIIEVARFKGLQVTGVSVSQNGRIFANFPHWRPNVPLSVVEVMKSSGLTPSVSTMVISTSPIPASTRRVEM